MAGQFVIGSLVVVALASPAAASSTDPCAAPTNPIVCENSKPGTPDSVWDANGVGDDTIQGFTTDTSVNLGGTLGFKVKTPATSYKIDIYRMGYYQGNGARYIASTTTPVPKTQPSCLTDATTGLYDCGNWSVSATWTVPSTAVSGMYVALLTRNDTGGTSNIPFVVRDDSSHSDMVYQASDTTWQAYNYYGGSDFYQGSPAGRSYKVSFNRPYSTRNGANSHDYLWSNEYPMIRYLESNGYNVSYISGIDTDRYGSLLLNHKVFLSVGHDEYWSGQQRTNVEAARDSGVNLAFFSGNEVYWKTRYEKSIDGANTDYRTEVCYKETWANSKIDPQPVSTATWRDGRYGPDGGVPENGLTGTAFMANNVDLAMKVPQAQGKTRFWRNTSVANLGAGAVATLPNSTIGYESDEDLDNGYRPKGMIKLSLTTGPTPQILTNYGPDVTTGTTTHSMTLYRANGGALVFAAGTIQYAWGLDSNHDGTQNPASVQMQQATVNLFADMGVQPLSLVSGLTAATASTDTTAPTSVITSPSAGATQANGSTVTISGTATDAGGGIVAGVEVSADGGSTWHPANGTASWSYTYRATGSGPVKLLSRATDDSVNTETPGAGVTVTVNCPCSLFGNATPPTAAVADGSDTELGVRFTPQLNGVVTGIRFYKGTGNGGTHTGTLWDSSGAVLSTGTFTGETATGWQTLTLSNPVTITAGSTYTASYRAPQGHYADEPLFFDRKNYVSAPLIAPRSYQGQINGVFNSGGQFPSKTFNLDNYYVDVQYTPTSGSADTTPPVISAVATQPGSTTATVSWTTDESASSIVQYGTSPSALTKTASTSGLSTLHSVFITGLAPTTQYYFRVTSSDVVNNAATSPAAAASPATWTTTELGACPCTLFDASATPASADGGDGANIEVGVKLVPSVSGYVTGLRFYKSSANGGVHVGTLWSSTGTALASATFRNEGATGWQSVTFPNPVLVTAGTTYIASYRAPNGHYSVDAGYFATAVTNGPWTAPASSTGSTADGSGNGLYLYGGGFPTNSFNAGNYWIDAVFYPGTPPADTTAPAISGVTATASSTSVKIGWTTNEQSTSVVTYGTSATALTSTATASGYDTVHTVRLTGLAPTTTYYYRVTSADAAGNTTTSPVSSATATSFVTSQLNCPCSLFDANATPSTVDSGDGATIEVGVKITATANGLISGMRFFKAATNTGTHVGTLWSSTGTALATGTFTGESASGWQTLTFANPIAVTSGTNYVVSYSTPAGHYSIDTQYFADPLISGALTGVNGVFKYGTGFPTNTFNNANYWVDATFQLPAGGTTGPVISGLNVNISGQSAALNWTTDKAATSVVDYGTSPTALTSTISSAALVTAHTVSLSGLAKGLTYYYRVTSSDAAGNATTSPATSSSPASFTLTCPCTLFDDAAPANPDSGDTAAIELGVQFKPSMDGKITGVRFYKSAANVGTHTGTLWTPTGTQLATGTFTGETATGWQTLTFVNPVAVTAGTTYVASYNAPSGHYAGTGNYFATDYVSGPLTAPAGNNGLYLYGSGFPASSFNATNYWVDPVFTTGTVADTTPPTVLGTTPAAGATNVTSQVVTASFSEPISTSSLAFTLANGATSVPGTVTYDSTSNTATFTATAALPPAATLTASAKASDTAGNAMASATTWQFSTKDTAPPTVTATTPASGATNVALTVPPTATFSKAIDPATVVASITPAGGTAMTTTTSYDAPSRTVTIAHAAAFVGSTTYTVSIKASDTVGNAMTAPTTWTFSTPDTTPPTVTAVTASGTGTTGTVTWTTDEASTSVVNYGTTATALTSSATTAGLVTSHTVNLTGLAANTRYYYRVTSADAAGNSTTSPASTATAANFAPTPAPVTQTTAADFNTGTVNSTYVGSRAAGEVILAPAAAQEFAGTTVPTGWTSTSLATGSSVTVGSGVATVSGRLFKSTSTYSSGRMLDSVVTMTPGANQWWGMTDGDYTSNFSSWVSFHTTAAGALVAETRNGFLGSTSTNLPSSYLGAAHRFAIDWNGSTVTYSIDGTTVATHSRNVSAALAIVARDPAVDANTIKIDSVWLTPYATSGTFTSGVIDAGNTVDWQAFTPAVTLPTGTTITYQVRSGPNATAGGTGWSAFTAVASGGDIPGVTRYLQYRATLTTTTSASRISTPTLTAVSIALAVP